MIRIEEGIVDNEREEAHSIVVRKTLMTEKDKCKTNLR
jgi:hypothetical protein